MNNNEWISVNDRLPERAKRVLVTDGNIVCEANLNIITGKWQGWHCLSNEYLDTPTHWMPLPEPPKESSCKN